MIDPMISARPDRIVQLDRWAASHLIRDLLRIHFREAQRREPSYASLQAALYHIRRVSGLSTTELASRLHIKPQAVSIVECGSSSFSASVLERLAQIAGQYCLPLAAHYIRRLAARARHKSYRQGGKR